MPTFCISDLHLCDRGPRDNFAYNGREERFYQLPQVRGGDPAAGC